jgi:hypothetical protein
MTGLEFVLSIATLVHDAKGFTKPMPMPLAQAIVDAAVASPLFEGPLGPVQTMAVEVVFAFREGSYDVNISGDHRLIAGVSIPRACGTFETFCSFTPLGDARRQAVIFLREMRRSFIACPEFPAAFYAGGSCDNVQAKRISSARLELARELAATWVP